MWLLLFSRSVVSSSLLLHGLQHARLPCPHVILKKKKTGIFEMAWWVKNQSAMQATQETQILSLGGEDPLEKEMATHFSIHVWKTPWREEPGRSQSWT